MIQPAALPATLGLALPGEVLPVVAGEGSEPADFEAFLSIESNSLAAPVAVPQLSAEPATAVVVPSAIPAILPDSGKTLPVDLPDAGPVKANAGWSEPAPTRAPGLAPLPAQLAAPSEPRGNDTPLPVRGEVAAAPEPTLAPTLIPVELVAVSSREAGIEPQAQSPARPGAPIPPQPGAFAAPDAPSPVSAPVAAQTALRVQNHIAIAQAPVPGPISLTAITLDVEPAAQAETAETQQIGKPQPLLNSHSASLELALKGPPGAITTRRPNPGKAAPPAASEPALPTIVPSTPVLPQSPSTLTAPPPPAVPAAEPAPRPHDFTQLVERLTAARELVQPQAFQLAVQHGEFGEVRLRFRLEGEGLNVNLANADPDFAQALGTAPAPVLPSLPAETSGQGGQRFEQPAQNATGNGGAGQQRGAPAERRDERPSASANQEPPRPGDARPSRRGGIFA